jgi:RecJ-like exonuclease
MSSQIEKSQKSTQLSKKTRIICLSHKEDADGISAAALIRQAFGGETVLVDYPGQMDALKQISKDEKLKTLFICDLGLSKKNQDEFVEILSELRKNKISIIYIDHHDIEAKIFEKLEKLGVKMIHNIDECTSILVYNKFKRKLSERAAFLAACAAITDYMEDRPIASKLLQTFDRQFALINATVLTYNIVGRQKDNEYLLYLVDELSESKYPHEIPNSYEIARIQVEKLAQIMATVKKEMKTMKNLGYLELANSGASGAVNFVLGFSGKDVGVAYKERVDQGIYAVSVRGSKNCKIHLGKIINSLATELGGSGGGHDKACGAVIPKPKIKEFLREFDKRLNKQ